MGSREKAWRKGSDRTKVALEESQSNPAAWEGCFSIPKGIEEESRERCSAAIWASGHESMNQSGSRRSEFGLPKYISAREPPARAFLFPLSCDLRGSCCPWEVSVRAVGSRPFPRIFQLGLARSLALSSRLHIAGPVPPVSPRVTKTWVSALCQDPIKPASSNLPRPGRQHAPSEGPGDRPPRGALPPTPEGEGGGRGRAPGDPWRPARPAEGPQAASRLQPEGAGGRHRSLPLTQRQRSGRAPVRKGPGKLQRGHSGDPHTRAVAEGWRKPEFACNSGDERAGRRARPARKRARETGAARGPGARRTLAARGTRGCPAGGRRRRQRRRPPARFPWLGSAGGEAAAGDRKRAAVAARARTASPARAHTRTRRRRRLPPPPAGFLPLRGPGCSGRLQRARLRRAPDPAPHPAAVPDSSSPSITGSPPPRPRPPLPLTQLQPLATPLRAPAAPAPGAGHASGPPHAPRPRARANQRPASPPLSAGAAPSAAATHLAGLLARRPAGRSSGPADPSCRRARLLLPARRDALGGRAGRSGFAPAGPARLLPRLRPSRLPGVFETRGGGSGGDGGQVQT
ncbi:serine/arginine repetitive matrix protein 1-like [Hippopotamus amphibius kiboko]|uniref:serine/arginine repetitive matrix protein 1-like n=1 Tax=Hippopotamus amphibius kiboko TaxID=575201 RepID=UPI0025978169|nr:serine/arginine repetitive matrix protein 1-like [Hippopotamus amphibius kiboko]